mmetsp:Transcript_8401/g.7525  ORF Transcript_8401/g.7525 Transcript_8401/m.7525 type:complete len:223 (-) Transcript_8401:107-775(-)
MIKLFIVFIVLLQLLSFTISYKVKSTCLTMKSSLNQFNKFITIGLTSLSFNFITPIQPSFGIDAFDAATKAMLEKKEKPEAKVRDLDSLPIGAKKRRALTLCKQDSIRKAAGFSSASECNTQVLSGNFDAIFNPKVAVPVTKTITSTASTNEITIKKEETRPTSKKLDLSTLTIAQKKRRALAACKKPDVRQFANAGSESKCSANVNRGEYEAIIDALEYGL